MARGAQFLICACVDYRDAATITGDWSAGPSAMTMVAQKKLNAAAADIKPIVDILRMFKLSVLLLFVMVRCDRRRIIGKAR